RRVIPQSSKGRRWMVGGLAAAAMLTAVVATSIVVGGQHAPAEPANIAASAPVSRPATEADLTSAVRGYYALLPTNPTAALARLTPKARDELGGASTFTNYWRPIKWVRLLGTTVSAPDHTVRAQLRLQSDGGQIRTMPQRLVLVPGPNGDWLIDAVAA